MDRKRTSPRRWLAGGAVLIDISYAALLDLRAYLTRLFERAWAGVVSSPAAAYLLTMIEGMKIYVEKNATPPDPERLARVLKPFIDAGAELHRRLHRPQVPRQTFHE